MHTYSKEREFERFRETCESRAYSFALRLTRNRDDAHDLLQDALIRAWRAFNPLGRAPSEAWLKQIVFNCFLDSRRSANRRPLTISLEMVQAQNQHFDPPDSSQGADMVLSGEVIDRRLAKVLGTLSNEQRSLVLAHVVNEVPYTTLAEIYGTRVGTIKSRIFRALELLRARVDSEECAQGDCHDAPQAA